MSHKQNTRGAKRSVASMILFGCMATAAGGVYADAASDLLREVAAQKARLEQLEKKLEAVTKEAASAKETARVAQEKVAAAPAVPAAGEGNLLPKGFTIYGVADGGLEYANYGLGYKTRVQSGMGTASRLGFKGERSFSDDLTAYFTLEAGVSIDNGQSTNHSSNISNPGYGTLSSSSTSSSGVAIFSRQTFLGLRSKKFGDIHFGRDYAPIYTLARDTDPFSIGGATAYKLWAGLAAGRFDNGAFYSTPSIAGFQASAAYSAGMENNSNSDVGATGGAVTNAIAMSNQAGPKDEGRGTSGVLTYRNGPLLLGTGYLSFFRSNATVSAPATEPVNRKAYNLGGSYDFKVAKLFAQYIQSKDTQAGLASNTTADKTFYWLGVAMPFGGVHTVRATYGHLNDKLTTNKDSDHYGIGYEYALDKQTDLYTYYAQTSNKNGGTNAPCAGGVCQGFDAVANFTPKVWMMGGRYRF
ncbi:porin [Propionivibrio dicarboxylicus]|uniref:Outer membrane protein (Porin) n=1 Tax=Propionivibrio dicarboxylicus TaxID=83767 RepID=A0A1G8LS36_9RHOO|nr:porin [Propionivibrio dicarboxylicus]SDI58476.1 Outer membrane protein (porin) [Propionivibrio dicarboxylicus]